MVGTINRNDVVTFGLALVAAVITFFAVSTEKIESNLMFVLAFVIFGALLLVKSLVNTLH